MKDDPSARPEWMDLRSLTEYADISSRTLGDWIRDPTDPLPASQVGRKILVRRSAFDDYLERHRMAPSSMLDDILKELDTPGA
jgi:hypothetical protein